MKTALALATLLFALPATADEWVHTGDGIRTKKVAFFHVKVYAIDHAMKDVPADHSKQGIINAEVDKKLEWKMLRSVDAEKIRNALREAYAKNSYGDAGKIEQLIAPINRELKEGATVTIRYDAASKQTTLETGGAKATVAGADFMRATWSIWFGNIDQPSHTDSLLSKLK
jgi:hypothetical protein